MAFYYVKSGGTATGDAGRSATQRTGSFAAMGASAYYPDPEAAYAATTPPVDGDSIHESDLSSNADVDAVRSITFVAGTDVVCVNDEDVQSPARTGNSALEGVSSVTRDFNFSSSIPDSGKPANHYSMTYKAGNNLRIIGTHKFYDCKLRSGDNIIVAQADGMSANVYSGSIIFEDSISAYLQGGRGSFWRFYGVNFGLAAIARINKLLSSSGNGGGRFEFYGCDLSSIMDASSTGGLVEVTGSSNDVLLVTFNRCKLPVGVPVMSGTRDNGAFEVDLIGCGTATNDEFSIEKYRYQGQMISEVGTAHFRAGDTKLPDATNYLTYNLTPNTKAKRTDPLRLFVPMRYENDFASNGKCKLYMSCNTAGLTNTDFWIEPYYADATDAMRWKRTHTCKVGTDNRIDPISPGDALATETGQWTGGGSNEYILEATLTDGGDGLVGVMLCCHDNGLGTTDFYVSSTVGLNA